MGNLQNFRPDFAPDDFRNLGRRFPETLSEFLWLSEFIENKGFTRLQPTDFLREEVETIEAYESFKKDFESDESLNLFWSISSEGGWTKKGYSLVDSEGKEAASFVVDSEFRIPKDWKVVKLDFRNGLPKTAADIADIENQVSGLPQGEEVNYPPQADERVQAYFVDHEQPPYYRYVWFRSPDSHWEAMAGRQGIARVHSVMHTFGEEKDPLVMDWFLTSMS